MVASGHGCSFSQKGFDLVERIARMLADCEAVVVAWGPASGSMSSS